MSGISGSWLGGHRDLSPAEDAFYGRQIEAIRNDEKLAKLPKSIRRRRPRTKGIGELDRSDEDADRRADG